MSHLIERREFVGKLGRIGALCGAYLALGQMGRSAETKSFLKAESSESFVGKWFIENHPQSSSPAKLSKALFGVDLEGIQKMDEKALASKLRKAIASDFSNGNILSVERWRLSASECQFLALISQISE